MRSLAIVVPDELDEALTEVEIQAIAQEAVLVRLYALGRLGSGRAAQLLGTTRHAFLTEVLGRHGVAWFDEDMDPAAEAKRG